MDVPQSSPAVPSVPESVPGASKNKPSTWLVAVGILVVAVILAGAYWTIKSNSKGSDVRVYHVGVISGINLFAESTNGFKDKMAELGYKEGDNIVYDVRVSEIDPVAYKKAAEDFLAQKVDLIFSFPTEATQIAKEVAQNSNIPVVFGPAGLEGTNLVESIGRPGGNITGVQLPSADTILKRLEILHEIVPQAKRIWMPYLKGYPTVPPQLAALKPAAEALGITIIEVPATGPDDIRADLIARSSAKDPGMDAILLMIDPMPVIPGVFPVISDFAAKYKVPIGGLMLTSGDYGSLFGYIPEASEFGRQAALLADKVLRGIPAGEIPVATPNNTLVLNYKLAQQMGLHLSEGIMSRADKIIR